MYLPFGWAEEQPGYEQEEEVFQNRRRRREQRRTVDIRREKKCGGVNQLDEHIRSIEWLGDRLRIPNYQTPESVHSSSNPKINLNTATLEEITERKGKREIRFRTYEIHNNGVGSWRRREAGEENRMCEREMRNVRIL